MSEERFWAMTLRSFHRLVRARVERERRRAELVRLRERAADRRAAWVVATIMNYAGKQLPEGRTVTVEELLDPPKPLTETDYHAAKARLEERVARRRARRAAAAATEEGTRHDAR